MSHLRSVRDLLSKSFGEILKNTRHVATRECCLRFRGAALLATGACMLLGVLASQGGILAQADQIGEPALHARLSLQPEADKLRRRLGQRYLKAGRETAMLTGVLTTGTARLAIRILRLQDVKGESVAISLEGRQSDFTWTGATGPLYGGAAVTDADRTLVERIVLDSADQFIQAQQRGAAYITIGRGVRPNGSGGSRDYTGPIWDVVRVGEFESLAAAKPLSLARTYFINSRTGLLEKVVSNEEGDLVTAEFAGLSARDGEMEATEITWSSKGKMLMRLTIDSVAYASRQ